MSTLRDIASNRSKDPVLKRKPRIPERPNTFRVVSSTIPLHVPFKKQFDMTLCLSLRSSRVIFKRKNGNHKRITYTTMKGIRHTRTYLDTSRLSLGLFKISWECQSLRSTEKCSTLFSFFFSFFFLFLGFAFSRNISNFFVNYNIIMVRIYLQGDS